MKSPKHIVREGYDKLSTNYRLHFGSHKTEYIKWIDEFTFLVPAASPVLELGCGDGIPVAQLLALKYDYTGVDISPVQIDNARHNVPSGQFLLADMSEVQFAPGSFHSVIALYSIIHVPLQEQESLLRKMSLWLQPGGYLLCTLGVHEWTGIEEHWIERGTTMYWSHASADQYEEWFVSMGFVIIKKEFVPEGNSGHMLFMVQKSNDR